MMAGAEVEDADTVEPWSIKLAVTLTPEFTGVGSRCIAYLAAGVPTTI